MKSVRLLVALFSITLGCLSLSAQTPAAAPAPAVAKPAAPKVIPTSRLAWINTQEFSAEEGGIKQLVRVKLGISIVPYQAVAREVSAGQLFCARIAGRQLFRETGWVHLKSNHLPRAVQEMKRILEEIRPRLKMRPDGPIA